MTDSQKRFLGVLVRAALLFVATKIGLHKASDGPLFGIVLDETTAQIMGWLVVLPTLAWSAFQKWRMGRKLAVAIALPPVVNGQPVTEADVNKVMKATAPGTVPTPVEAAQILGDGKP